jgi:DNA-binding PadR family transcriptional regulator
MALSHAILSALIGRSCSGYDLAKQFDGSVGFFWQASHQQIYRELARLAEQGLVSAEAIPQEGRPDKKLYSVTEAGQDFLKEWIGTPTEMSSLKDDLLVKLFAGHLVPKPTIAKEAEHHRQQHVQRLVTYRQIEQTFFANPQALDVADRFRYLTLRSGIRYEIEWLAWCEEVMQFLGEI